MTDEAFIKIGKMVALFGDIENIYNNVIAKYYVDDPLKIDEFFVNVMRAKHVNLEMKRSLALEIISVANPEIYKSINKSHTKQLISLRNIVAHSSILNIPNSYKIVFMGANGKKCKVDDIYNEVFKIGIPARDSLLSYLISISTK
jgi:hypothetical protein